MFGALLGVALGVIGTVVASAINARAQSKAVEQANEANAALMREQQQYQTSERLAAQEYNLPAAQRQRFEQAGINPYMALGQMNAGNTEAQVAPSTPTMEPAADLSIGNAIERIGEIPSKAISAIQGVQQVNANKEAIESQRITNMYKAQDMLSQIEKNKAEIQERMSKVKNNEVEYKNLEWQLKLNEQMYDRQMKELKYADDYFSARSKREKHLADLAYQQQIGQWIDNRIQSIHSQYASRLDAATLQQLNASASKMYSDMALNKQLGNLYDQEASTEFTLRAYKKAGLKLDNFHKDIALQYLGEQLSTGIEAQKAGIRQANQDYYNPFKFIGGAGAALGAAFGGALGAGTKGAAAAGAASRSSYTPSYGFTNMPTQGY